MSKKTDERVSLLYVLTHALCGYAGFSEEDSSRIAQDVLTGMNREGLAGEYLYCPSIATIERRQRDAAIVAEFNGRNVTELAKKHGTSPASVYRAVERMRRKLAA